MSITQKGNWDKTRRFLERSLVDDAYQKLDQFGQDGVRALSSATPVDSGETANSWYYTIKKGKGWLSIAFYNSNIVDGVPIAILLQYGHGTKNGGYVQGRDYINPAIQPVFDKIADSIWREVVK